MIKKETKKKENTLIAQMGIPYIDTFSSNIIYSNILFFSIKIYKLHLWLQCPVKIDNAYGTCVERRTRIKKKYVA